MELVSGSGQTGRLGEPLLDPFVVHVWDGIRDLPNVDVSWTVTSGQGAFQGFSSTQTDAHGIAEIYFLPSTHRATVRATAYRATGSVEFTVNPEPQALYTTSQTSGAACEEWCSRYTFYPDGTFDLTYRNGSLFTGDWTLQKDVLLINFSVNSGWQARATVHGTDLDVRYNTGMDLSDFEDATYALVRSGPVPYWLPATFTAIAGDNQSGTPGQFLSEPLSVQLTNILGAALKDVIVEWRVTSGGGELSWAPGVAAEMTQSTTNISGITGVFFRPLLPGRTVVQAVTPTLTASPVSFTIDVDPNAAPWVLVYFGPQFECLDDECVNVRQLAPTTFYGIPSEGVPLGTTLEFVSCCGVTQLASVLVPQGGSTFKSEPLVVGQRFAVVLDAVGTWVFEELRWGGRDSIKVTPRP